MRASFRFSAPVWLYEGPASWYFVSLPEDCADEIADLADGQTRGFGSVRVSVRVGETSWTTSVFPDKARNTYVLPIKKSVRTAENLADGTLAQIELGIVD